MLSVYWEDRKAPNAYITHWRCGQGAPRIRREPQRIRMASRYMEAFEGGLEERGMADRRR